LEVTLHQFGAFLRGAQAAPQVGFQLSRIAWPLPRDGICLGILVAVFVGLSSGRQGGK